MFSFFLFFSPTIIHTRNEIRGFLDLPDALPRNTRMEKGRKERKKSVEIESLS